MFLSTFIRFCARLMMRGSQQLQHTLLPSICVLCTYPTRNTGNICSACEQDLPILPHSCMKCANFLPHISYNNNPSICGHCLVEPPPFSVTHALFPYEAPVVELIIKLKFQQQLSYAELLGRLMANAILTRWYNDIPLPDLILPIPLHPQRLKERGFNQAIEIARPIKKLTHIPLDIHGSRRIRPTQAQSGLLATDRKLNVAKAFVFDADYRDKHIAVLDDVITTGHTMQEFCTGLKAAGAKRIDVWCCARRGQS